MAGIDKTYIDNWETFDKIRNWAKGQKFQLKNGQTIHLEDYEYNPNLTKEEWDRREKEHYEHSNWKFEVVLWNTPTYVDIWLIRNCPFKEIQDRLKEQYGGGWSKQALTDHNNPNTYEQIKAGISIYDTYQRNGLGYKAKVKFKNIYGKWFRDKRLWWWIDIKEPCFWDYNEHDNMWYCDEEAMPWTSNTCHISGTLTKKNILNLIRKWNLPKNTVIRFEALYGRCSIHKFLVTVK